MGVTVVFLLAIVFGICACCVCVPVSALFKLYCDRRKLWYCVTAILLAVFALVMFFPACTLLSLFFSITIISRMVFWAVYSGAAIFCILLLFIGIKSKQWWSIMAIYGGTVILLPELGMLAVIAAEKLGAVNLGGS